MNKKTVHNQDISLNNIKPDVLIEYNFDKHENLPISVIYVRPETNVVSYEKSIIKGLAPFSNVKYMANLNGKLFIKDALILEHYASQYRFAIFGKEEISQYPEMVEKIEKHFGINFEKAEIIGSFEAILKLKMKHSELFNVFVNDNDFLKLYGQTIKKINDIYVVNYDIPALIEKYNPKANIFVIVIQFKKENISFMDINHSISEELQRNSKAPILYIDNDKYEKLNWIDKVKRTYHISNTHVMALFDMVDFIFNKDGSHIDFSETVLGKKLIDTGITIEQLKIIKEHPIVYLDDGDEIKLVNIIEEAFNKNIDECVEMIHKIIW